MQRKNPALPATVRPIFWVLRALGTATGAVAVACAVWLARQGEWRIALVAIALGVPFAVLTWLHPMSNSFAVMLALMGLSAGALAGAWVIASITCAIAAWSLWSMRRPLGANLNMDIQEAAPDAVMKGARKHVEAFASAGFERVGAYQGRYHRIRIIPSLLLSPDARSYASVTDVIWNVTSLFPGGRRLVTRNMHYGTLPENVLVNAAPGAPPLELLASHHRALATLAAHGQVPLPVAADDLVRFAINTELETLEWARTRGRTKWRREGRLPLWDRPDAAERIDAWLDGRA